AEPDARAVATFVAWAPTSRPWRSGGRGELDQALAPSPPAAERDDGAGRRRHGLPVAAEREPARETASGDEQLERRRAARGVAQAERVGAGVERVLEDAPGHGTRVDP